MKNQLAHLEDKQVTLVTPAETFVGILTSEKWDAEVCKPASGCEFAYTVTTESKECTEYSEFYAGEITSVKGNTIEMTPKAEYERYI